MGEVYLAADRDGLPRKVALKLLAQSAAQDDPAASRRFRREAEMVSRLRHPNIVTIFARGEERGRLWIAMDHIAGSDLGKVLHAGPLAPKYAVSVISQVAAALDYAYDVHGVLHRDVKPANVLLDEETPRTALLTDFGIAKAVDESVKLTNAGDTLATAQYAAPERFETPDVADRRSDVYSLGCMLFYMLTGRLPYEGTNFAVLCYQHIHGDIPAPTDIDPHLPPACDKVIACALAKNPNDRFATSLGLAEAAERAFSKETERAPNARLSSFRRSSWSGQADTLTATPSRRSPISREAKLEARVKAARFGGSLSSAMFGATVAVIFGGAAFGFIWGFIENFSWPQGDRDERPVFMVVFLVLAIVAGAVAWAGASDMVGEARAWCAKRKLH